MEIFVYVQKLESFNILDVPIDVVSKVERIVAGTEKMGIMIGWLDKVIRDVCGKRVHSSLMQENQ